MEQQGGSQAGGFSFDLCQRNALLENKGMKGPGFTKTGTTIAGVVFKARAAGAARRRCLLPLACCTF